MNAGRVKRKAAFIEPILLLRSDVLPDGPDLPRTYRGHCPEN
jgi:hypothetical protein